MINKLYTLKIFIRVYLGRFRERQALFEGTVQRPFRINPCMQRAHAIHYHKLHLRYRNRVVQHVAFRRIVDSY